MQQLVTVLQLRAAEFGEHGCGAAAQALVHAAAGGGILWPQRLENRKHGLPRLFERKAETQHSRHLKGREMNGCGQDDVSRLCTPWSGAAPAAGSP